MAGRTQHDLALIRRAEEVGAGEALRFARARSDHRFLMGGVEVTCELTQPGGTRTRVTAGLIDLSASGMQLMYPGFVHATSLITAHISLVGRRPLSIEGVAVWCRMLSGRQHLLGVRACDRIPIRDIVGDDAWLKACEADPELQAPLAGELVVVSHDELLAESIKLHTAGTQVNALSRPSVGAVLDEASLGRFAMLLIDADDESLDCSGLIAKVRERGFAGPIIVVSVDPEAGHVAMMDPMGRSRFVPAPLRTGALLASLRDIVRDHPECLSDAEPIFSDAPEHEGLERTLQAFITRASEVVEHSKRALATNDDAALRELLATLARNGGSYGYVPLSEAATAVLEAHIAESRKVDALMGALEAVVDRLQPSRAA